MVYGEGEGLEETKLVQRYPTLPSGVGIEGFRSHCFICQPSVVFRRSMAVLLGEFDQECRTAFDFDYWLRAFDAFPHRTVVASPPEERVFMVKQLLPLSVLM